MGLSPLTRQAGQASQTSLKPKPTTSKFRPINLNVNPVLNGCGPNATARGLVFSGNSAEVDDLSNAFQCSGKYSLQNTHHYGVAGVTDDGSLIFAVSSRIDGRYRTTIGGFDVSGKPKPPTLDQQRILTNLLPNSENRIVMDAKSSGALGFKTNGTNPSAGVYVGDKKIIYDLGFRISDDPGAKDPKRHITANASVTTDFNNKVTSQAFNIAARSGSASMNAAFERSGTTDTHKLSGAVGDWSASASQSYNKGAKTRQLDIGYRINDDMTLTASWKPDNRPPTSLPPDTFKNPAPFQDFSNYSIKLEIKL